MRAARRLDEERRSVAEQAPLENQFRERKRARRAGGERRRGLRCSRRWNRRHRKIEQREKRGIIFHHHFRRVRRQALQGFAAFAITAGCWLLLDRRRVATVAEGVSDRRPRRGFHQPDRAMIRRHQPRRHQHRDDERAQQRGLAAKGFHDAAMNAEDWLAFKQSFAGRVGWRRKNRCHPERSGGFAKRSRRTSNFFLGKRGG